MAVGLGRRPSLTSSGGGCDHGAVYISARVDYATRALLALAAVPTDERLTGEALAAEQGLPAKFVENILVDLRRAGFVASQRGAEGGYRLGRPAAGNTVAAINRPPHRPPG